MQKQFVVVCLAVLLAVVHAQSSSAGGIWPPQDSTGPWGGESGSDSGSQQTGGTGGGGNWCEYGQTWSYTGMEPCYPCTQCDNSTVATRSCYFYWDTICEVNLCALGVCGSDPNTLCYQYQGGVSCYCRYGYAGNPPYTGCIEDVNRCYATATYGEICRTYFDGNNNTFVINDTYSTCDHYNGNTWCGCYYPAQGGGYWPNIQPCQIMDPCSYNNNYGYDYCAAGGGYCFYNSPYNFQCGCYGWNQYWDSGNQGPYNYTMPMCVNDVDECYGGYNNSYNGDAVCSMFPNSYCNNYIGPSPSYNCLCNYGYNGNPPYSQCSLYPDYCAWYGSNYLCGEGATCTSTPYSYYCTSTETPTDCGVLLPNNECQVGYLNPPSCCTRISDFHPVASAQASGSDIVFTIANANALPWDYSYVHGLTASTQGDLFPPQCTFYASQSPSFNYTNGTMYSYSVPFSYLGNCLAQSFQGDRLRFEGYVGLSLSYVPWGTAAHVGLWFFQIRVDILNSTQVVSLLSVTPESFENTIDVEIHPQASLMHCTDSSCNQADITYFSRVGDTEYYRLSVDAGSVAGTASLTALLLEDLQHNPIFVAPHSIISQNGLTLVFSFTVPPGTALVVKFLRALISVDFLDTQSFQWITFAGPRTDVLLASSRFEILPAIGGSGSAGDDSSATVTSLSVAVAAVVTAFVAFMN